MQGQRLPEMADGLSASALPQFGNAQVSQGPGLAQPAADLAAHPDGPLEMAGRLDVTALPQFEFAEVAQHIGLTGPEPAVAEQGQ